MKREKLILIKGIIRAYFLYTILLFGLAILIKHLLFSEEWNRDKITEALMTSLFIAIFFVIMNREPFSEKNKEGNANPHVDKEVN